MHEKHRERIRNRYLKEGFSSFDTHQLLEVLLFYAKPRGDTNECAHALLERFGSLKALFEATDDERQEVEGIGLNTSMMFSVMVELLRRYDLENTETHVRYDRMTKVCDYLPHLFRGVPHECLYMLMFNNRMNLIDCRLISTGTVNSTNASIPIMAKLALQKNASAVIMAHNHPQGIALPSHEDINITELAKQALQMLGIALTEHFVYADDAIFPIMKSYSTSMRFSARISEFDPEFYQEFYDRSEDSLPVRSVFEKAPLMIRDKTEK